MNRVICLLGFGEVGQTIVPGLLAAGFSVRAADTRFSDENSSPSRAAAALNDVQVFQSSSEAVAGCQLVISAVTASNCLQAVQQCASGLSLGSYFLDLNSVSPKTTNEAACLVGSSNSHYIEAAVMSPIQPHGLASPMLLGGPHAQRFLDQYPLPGFTNATVFSDALGQASAAKMCRSVVVKGMEALVTEALLGARHYGVESAVLESLSNQFPHADWQQHARYLIGRSVQHGVRRAEEMQEVSKTLIDAGCEPWMSDACVQRQQTAASLSAALGADELMQMLDQMRSQLNEQRRTGGRYAGY